MVSFQKAQTGARVYLGARQSPNRGQVSSQGAQGYIQRELRNKNSLQQGRLGGRPLATPVGSDGKSDSRSAVAAQALKRKNNMQLGGRPNLNQGGKNKPWEDGRPVVPAPGAPPQTPQTPQVIVNDAGLLELPYNQDFSMDQYNALNEANDQLLGLKSEADQQGLEYTKSKRETQLGYEQLRGQTLNQNAAAGTAFSSRYGTAVANNANAFANQMGDLEAANTSFTQNQALQRAAIQNALNQQLGLGVQQYAGELGDQAGSLGYGNATQQVKEGRNTSIYHQGPRGSKNKKGNKGSKGNKGRNKSGSRQHAAQNWLQQNGGRPILGAR